MVEGIRMEQSGEIRGAVFRREKDAARG